MIDGSETEDDDNGFEMSLSHDDEGDISDGGGPGGGGGRGHDDDDDSRHTNNEDSEEERPYDISIAASHSYLGPGLVAVRGRSVLEAGWRGRVPALAHHGVVFPGETVPMLLPNPPDAALLVQAINNDKLFGLLCPDEVGTMLSGYGVLCEVLMADIEESQNVPTSITFKARAIHRFKLLRVPKLYVPVHAYSRMRFVEVMVLAEMSARDPLRTPSHVWCAARRRAAEAAATPWPLFVYDIFHYDRMRHTIHEYFKTIMLEDKLPEEAVSLSFWVASNLALSAADRLALFAVDSALLRLHMECQFINRKSVLCCAACMSQIARREHIFPMSSEGVHSNYTNLGGYMHDILTVSETSNVETNGSPSAEYSWFPGYAWTVALCANCMAHVGWRFVALKRNLRPQKFYGLCRNFVQPRASPDTAPDSPHHYL